MTTRRSSRRGFMFLEMIGAIILLGVFALVASHLFAWSMRVVREAPLAEEQVQSFDAMLAALRDDVWSAAEIRAVDEKHVEAGAARWAVTDDKAVTRTAVDGTRTWPGIGERVRFEPGSAGIVVRVLDRRGGTADRIEVWSEVTSLRGVGR